LLDKELGEVECACSGKGKKEDKCIPGNGPRCTGARALVSLYTEAVAGHEAKLATMKPAQRENAGYAQAAEVLAAIPFVTVTPAEIERRLNLLLPFVVVVIAEVGTITFLSIGLGHAHTLATIPGKAPSPTIPSPGNPGPGIPRIQPKALKTRGI